MPESDPLLDNDRIQIEYVKPGASHLMPVYETMKEHQSPRASEAVLVAVEAAGEAQDHHA